MSKAIPFPPLRRGLVAILRGVEPAEAAAVAGAIHEAGIEAIEVPLNSPAPFASIAGIVEALPKTALVGAGTVVEPADVDRLAEAGGRLLVSPNIDAAVMRRAVRSGLTTMPGAFTASEAFSALRLGASALKIFPAGVLGPGGIAALRAVLPAGTVTCAVGGISEADFEPYRAAGVRLFGLGSSLFRPGMSAREAGTRALAAVRAWDRAFGESQ